MLPPAFGPRQKNLLTNPAGGPRGPALLTYARTPSDFGPELWLARGHLREIDPLSEPSWPKLGERGPDPEAAEIADFRCRRGIRLGLGCVQRWTSRPRGYPKALCD